MIKKLLGLEKEKKATRNESAHDPRRKYQHRPKPTEQVMLAQDMIRGLLRQADAVFSSDKKQADRYVDIARKVAMKYRLKLPPEMRRKYCKHCHSFLRPGVNCRVRIRKKNITYYCLECRKFMRFLH